MNKNFSKFSPRVLQGMGRKFTNAFVLATILFLNVTGVVQARDESYDDAATEGKRFSAVGHVHLSRALSPRLDTSVTYLSDLTWTYMTNGWGPVEIDKSNWDTPEGDGQTITLNGIPYSKGLGAHAYSEIHYDLTGQEYELFVSDIGVDDEACWVGSVVFSVYVDGVEKYNSGMMGVDTATKTVVVDVTDADALVLYIYDGGNGNTCDHADWADAKLLSGVPADTDESTMDISPAQMVVDATNSSTVTVTLKNSYGYPVLNQPVELAVATGAGLEINNTFAEVNEYINIGNTDANGVVTASIKSITAGTRSLKAQTGGLPLTSQPTVTFMPDELSAPNSTVTASTTSAPADGETPITVTVTALDEHDNPIPNILASSILLQATGDAEITQPTAPTNSQGQTSGQIVDATNEIVTVSATINSASLGNTIDLVFSSGDLSLSMAAPESAVANSGLNYTITVQQSNEMAAENVTLQLQLPEEVTYISQNSSVTPTQNGQTLTWNLGTLAAGQTLSFDVNGHTSASATIGETLDAQASITTTTQETILANNTATSQTTIVDGHGFTVGLSPLGHITGIGAPALYEVTVRNTGVVEDRYTISLDGLNSQWYTLSQSDASLLPGETASIALTLQVNSCETVGSHPFEVSVTSQGNQHVETESASVTFDSEPQVSGLVPQSGSTLGSRNVTINWQTDTPTTGILTIFPVEDPEHPSTFTSSEGTAHSIVIPNLDRNTTYEWYVDATSACGTNNLPHRTFTIGNGIVFVNRSQDVIIDRDYNQRVTLAVRNDDPDNSHTLTASLTAPYEDILVNFVDSGSTDQTVTLPACAPPLPCSTYQLTLAINAQDAEFSNSNYDLTASLVADKGSTPEIHDNMTLHVTVLKEGDYTIEPLGEPDELTLAQTYIITNHGKPITDFSLTAVDNEGQPARIFLQPSMDHARLDTGQSIQVTAYPIFTAEDAAQASTLSSSQPAASADGTFNIGLRTNQQSAVAPIEYELHALGAGVSDTVSGSVSCSGGKSIIPVLMQNCTMTFKTNDWYCTNRPVINTPMQIPSFINSSNITSANLSIVYAPQTNVQPHNGQVSFNGTQIGSYSNQIPTGQFSFDIPASTWQNSVAGNAIQSVQMTTQHPNAGHYVSATGYSLAVAVDQATTYVCADSQTSAQQVVMQIYPCLSTHAFNWLTDVYAASTFNGGSNKNTTVKVTGRVETDGSISDVACVTGECGDPINTKTGSSSFTMADLAFPTSAGDLIFQRSYSSATADVYQDTLGYGWTYNHDAKLIFSDDPGGMEGFVLFKSVLGNQYLFKEESDGSYTPGPGVLATLEKTSTAYTITSSQQEKFTFNLDGKLVSRENAQGRAFNYEYDTQGRLSKVSADSEARYIQIGYDEQGRIETVGDYADREVVYGYNAAGDLTAVTDVLGQDWTYVYDSNHHLTEERDPSGKTVVRTEYDMQGRAYRQFDGEDNLLVMVIYNSDGSTTIYDALNHSEEHQYDEHGIAVSTTNQLDQAETSTFDNNFRPLTISNAAGHTLTMTWSEDGVNLLSKTDPAGNLAVNTYDALNNLTSVTDPLGNETTYTYNGKLLASSTDALDRTTTYTYTPQGYLASVTDPANRTTSYTYDSFGQRTSMTDPDNKTWTYAYDSLGRMTDTTDPRGRVSHTEYNVAGQVIRSVQNYASARPQNDENLYNIVTEYEYDERGNQVKVTDTYGRITRYEYDDANRLLRTIDAANHITTNTYDAAGRLISTENALGQVTTYNYDATGRLLSTTNALGISSGTTTFSIANNTSTVTDIAGNSTTFHYDELGRVVRIEDVASGNSTYTTYDANGNVATRTDQLNRVTSYEYDALNRLIRTTDPLDGVTETTYDPVTGYRTATEDALGNATTYTYDDAGRLVATTDPLGRTTETEYDQYGRRTASIDADGNVTSYTYDLLDRVIAVTDPLDHTTSTTYDALGNVLTRTDENGHTSTTTYDVLNRPATSTDANGNVTTNVYDSVGNLISVEDALGNLTYYSYDGLNRQIAVTDPLDNITRTEYDSLGRVSNTIDEKGVITHYEYDTLGRQTAVILNYKPAMQADAETNVRYEYTYNAVGNRISVKDANGNITTYGYDVLNRVIQKTDPLDNTWTYGYDAGGRMISSTDAKEQATHYTYDAAGQVTFIDYPDGEVDVSFTYTLTGQRASMTDGLGTTTWTYDNLNRVTSETNPFGKTVSYSYDAAGNRTGLTYPDESTASYVFDPANQLVSVNGPSAGADYTYDAANRLTGISRDNGVNTTYSLDAAGQITGSSHSNTEGLLASYTYTYDAAGNITQAIENVNIPYIPPTSTPTHTATDTPTNTPTNTPTPTPTGIIGLPNISILDDFNRANGVIGSNWGGNISGYSINSDKLEVEGTGSRFILWQASYGPDQVAYVTMTNVDEDGGEQDLILKSQAPTSSEAIEVLYNAEDDIVQVWTYEDSQDWVQRGADIPVTFVDGDQFAARARPDGMVEVYRNGELLATRDVTAWPYYAEGGYIGLWFIGADDAILDDFGGGSLPTPFPQVDITDDFNRVNGGIGSNWSGNTGGYSISSNKLDVGTGNQLIVWQTSYGPDQAAYVTMTNMDEDGEEQNLILKSQSATSDGSGTIKVLYDAENDVAQVWTYEGSQDWVQRGTDIPVTFVDGDQFAARARADGIVEVYRNGDLLAIRDVTGWPYYAEGGYVGLRFIGAEEAVLDDFGGGSLPTAFPQIGIVDDFNHADGAIGGNWGGNTSGYSISSDKLEVAGTGSRLILWQTSYGSDQAAYVTMTNVDENGGEQDLILKSQSATSAYSGAIEVWYGAEDDVVQVVTYESSQGWVQRGADIPVTFVDGDQFAARARPDGMVEVYRNGELLATRDVTAWPYYAEGGYTGLWFIGADDAILDDFGGGTISNGSTPTPTNTPTSTPTPTPTPTVTPTPTSTPSADFIFSDGFESGDLDAWAWTEDGDGDISVSTAAAAVGSYGAQFVIDDLNEMKLADTMPNNDKHYSMRFYFDPNSVTIPNEEYICLFRAVKPSPVSEPFSLCVDKIGSYRALRMTARDDAGTSIRGRDVYITDDWQAVEVEWQAASAAGANDGFMKLWINDTLVDTISNIDDDTLYLNDIRFGITYVSSTEVTGTVYMDAFESRRGTHIGLDPNGPSLQPPLADVFFADGFESGDIESWSWWQDDDGDISTSTQAAAVGDFGAQFVIDDTHDMKLTDITPDNDKHYSMRFYFDPNSVSMPAGEYFCLFKAVNPSPVSEPFSLCVDKIGSYRALRMTARDDADTSIRGRDVYITDDWQAVEVEWQAASAAGANDGFMKLWINDTLVDTISNIDDDTLYLNDIRFGITYVSSTEITGTVYFDAFESRRGTYIGLDPNGPSLQPPLTDLIFADSLESGDIEAWSWWQDDDGDISVSTQAAAVGLYGAQFVIDDTNDMKLTDNMPDNDKHYSARFYFDPNSVSIPTGEYFCLLRGVKPSPISDPFDLCVGWDGTTYALGMTYRNDAGNYIGGEIVDIADDWQAIEVEWQAASAAGANDGGMTLRVNDTVVDQIQNIDNDTLYINEIRFGAFSASSTQISGTVYLDAFESRRDGHIGLDPNALAAVTLAYARVEPQPQLASASTKVPDVQLVNYKPLFAPQFMGDAPASAFRQQGTTLTITYTYDALNRLTSATYSDGRSFNYTYDANGNTLQLAQNLGPGTVTTTYNYDAANQLNTATEGSNNWQFTYDANGNLLSNGVTSYTYDSANRLIAVDGAEIDTAMAYNGLGQRLSMEAGGVTTQYVMDGNNPLTATSNGNDTTFLYGLGAIAEKTTSWNYALPDGGNTPRQLTDISGEVTFAARYTPWGDTLETYGTGNFAFGYFGGLMDEATGLLYVGNGQYYDPATGRFLTRGARPNQNNPYTPFDPMGALFAPLGLMALVYGRKRKGSKGAILLVILSFAVVTGMTLSGCGNGKTEVEAEVIQAPTATQIIISTPTGNPIATATIPPTPIPAGTYDCIVVPVPGGISGQFKITHYTIPQEDDPYFRRDGGYDNMGGGYIAITDDNGASWEWQFTTVLAFAVGNSPEDYDWSVLVNGSGHFNQPGSRYYGKYLHVAVEKYHGTKPDDPNSLFEILDEKPKPCGGALEPLTPGAQEVTIAVNQDLLGTGKSYTCGQKFTIDAYPGIIFKIGDAGSFTKNNNPDRDHFDIFVGEMHKKEFEDKFKNQSFFSNVQEVHCD